MANIRLRILSYIVIAYMLVAFAWWSILLFEKNNDAMQAKMELLRIAMEKDGWSYNELEFRQLPAYRELRKKYQRQEYMIFGEVIGFVFILLIGMYLINRGYRKEMDAAEQRRNFLLSITHELKSPIASIRLVLETFLKRKLDKAKMDQLSHNALEETERLHTLVNNLLFAARMETAYQPTLEDVNLSLLFRDLITKLRAKYPKARISFFESAPVPDIKGDKLGLESIALNLIENALKYTVEEHPVIGIKVFQSNGTVDLEVADQGVGIPDSEKKKIFEKFYRSGNEDTRSTKGTGLGLYIVKEVVKAHRGKILVEDNRPKGVIFKVKFPLK